MEETTTTNVETKFCKECGQKIAAKAVICPHCGCQVENLDNAAAGAAPQIVINNSNSNENANVNATPAVTGNAKNKWVAFLLCFLLGAFGAHKFYEGKIGMGILYLFTGGLCGIGVIVDLIMILLKPNPYYC